MFFRAAAVVVLIVVGVGQAVGETHAERKSGPCSLRLLSRDDFLKSRDQCHLVSVGERAKWDCFCAAEKLQETDNPHEDYSGYGIQLNYTIVNRTSAPVFTHLSIAFFDKDNNFLGGCMAPTLLEMKGGMRGFTSQRVYLPLDVLKRVASYRIVHYESDNDGSTERPRLRTNKTTLAAGNARHPQWHVFWAGDHKGIAQTIEGDCLIGYGSCLEVMGEEVQHDVSKMAFDVKFEGKARLKGGCSFWLDNFQRAYWFIDSRGSVTNPTKVPMYFQYCAAFFDASGDLVGCLVKTSFAGHNWNYDERHRRFLLGAEGLKPGEFGCPDLGSPGGDEIRIPDGYYETITSYKLTYYESAVPVGRESPVTIGRE